MRKFINLMNDDRVGMIILMCMLIVFMTGITIFTCVRDHQGLRQPAPLELTECASCSP